MPDFEKVTRGLAECIKENMSGCLECPYYADQIAHRDCVEWILRDALFLLKEQEKQLKEWEKHVPFLAAHGILKGDEDDA